VKVFGVSLSLKLEEGSPEGVGVCPGWLPERDERFGEGVRKPNWSRGL